MSLYEQNLVDSGIVRTNAIRLDEAISQLHSALCRMDSDQLHIFGGMRLHWPLSFVLNDYAKTEQLAENWQW